MTNKKLLTITGPTASGKTRLAALVADVLDGEIISADSRQVYKGMNIGTGKDYEDYKVNGVKIPYHLIDIAEAGSEYNVFQFQQDFLSSYNLIISKNKLPVLCGGTGMYIESVLAGYNLATTLIDEEFRKSLEDKTQEELQFQLMQLKQLHNSTDILDKKRLIRAIEIASFEKKQPKASGFPEIPYLLIAINNEREVIRNRITARLMQRLENGMIEEVKELLKKGLTASQLKFYGLEYRYITMYVNNEITYDEMFTKLNTAIHQFAKRQMTWFRRMEKKGIEIHWIDGEKKENEKVEEIIKLYLKA
ncbi:MAG: tRNA (adenosine(37)-N6)-dimethylallyltransferase MiaA [Bacteroidetes bacterium]|nr:tRNA (adenosine(37)-N6)-dimethylallyltransferase MiaA [Bacteroidota bacterium]